MDKQQAKILIDETFNESFDKDRYGKFIINLLDGIDTEGSAQFTCGNAYVPEAFRTHVNSYGRLGKYTDPNNQNIEVLWVNLKKETALDKARTMQRNFIAWYLNGGRGGKQRKNALVAFYNLELEDWRFSFVKAGTELEQTEKGDIKVKNKFSAAKRFSFLVGEQEPNHTAQKRLFEVLKKDSPTLADIEEAFNIEKVSKEFFAIYKALFLELVDDLKEIRKNDARINFEFETRSIKESDFCKKLMGQLVFLYFIQKKGWLGVERSCEWGSGDKKFLRTTFEKAQKEGRNFFNDYLEPLFYNALANGELDEDLFDALKCRIPFLNGGLFEPIKEYNWVDTDIVIPNEVFSNNIKTKDDDIGTGILDVFDRYNFTVKEDEPLEKEVAVDPEMLGKVFEELLEVEDRKSKGAFYTPREIVHYMCQESLINYLATELEAKVPKEDIAEFIHHGDEAIQGEAIAKAKEKQGVDNSKYEYILPQSIRDFAQDIDSALANVKICDPAIGSGAFPVGMMNEIIRARITLLEAEYIKKTKKTNSYEYKRQAIQNSIYGVDIDSGAIEIAKLRLWLSLVVDEDDMNEIKPLPNLDYKIVCGNSLLGVEKNLFNQKLFEQLEELKPGYFNCTQKREKKRLKKEIDAIISELTKDDSFDFEIYFSEVFQGKKGFDIVIGNPPYLGFQGIKKDFKEFLANKFKSASGKFDLYIIFIEQSYYILKENGFFSFICPTAFTKREHGKNIRTFLIDNTELNELIDFEHTQIFEKATNYTGIFSFKKSYKNKDNNFIYKNNLMNENIIKIKQIDLYNTPWIFINPKYANIIDKIKLNIPLGNLCKISEGVVTGLNDLYIQNQININNRNFEFEYFNKCYRGKDIDKYFTKNISDYLFYPYKMLNNKTVSIDENSLKTNSPIYYQFLQENKSKILAREYFTKSSKNWYELWNPRDINNFVCEKIITPELSERNRFVLEEDNAFYGDTVCGIKLKDNFKDEFNIKYLLAILNSSLIEWFYKKTTVPKAGGFFIYKVMFLKNIPIKKITLQEQQVYVNIVDKITELSNKLKNDINSDKLFEEIKCHINKIDYMVYELYNIEDSEILIINSKCNGNNKNE